MSWFDDNSGNPKRRRIALNIDDTGGSGGTVDVSMSIPKDLDVFWTNIESTGADDLDVTKADGLSAQTFQLSSFTYASRTMVLELDNFALVSTGKMEIAWLYFDQASPVNSEGSFTAATPETSHILDACPVQGPVLQAQPDPPGAGIPLQRISKKSTETLHVWWDITDVMERRCNNFAKYDLYEEPAWLDIDVELAGVSQSTMFTADETRLVFTPEQRYLVRTTIKAGSDGQDVTLILTVGITNGTTVRVADFRAICEVGDTAES